jgi:hypothetical protein
MGSAPSSLANASTEQLAFVVVDFLDDIEDGAPYDPNLLRSCREALASRDLSRGLPMSVASSLNAKKLYQLSQLLPPDQAQSFTRSTLDSKAANCNRAQLLSLLAESGIAYDDTEEIERASKKARIETGLCFCFCFCVLCFQFVGLL